MPQHTEKGSENVQGKESLDLKSLIQPPESHIGMDQRQKLADVGQRKAVFPYNVPEIPQNRQRMPIVDKIEKGIIADKGIDKAAGGQKDKPQEKQQEMGRFPDAFHRRESGCRFKSQSMRPQQIQAGQQQADHGKGEIKSIGNTGQQQEHTDKDPQADSHRHGEQNRPCRGQGSPDSQQKQEAHQKQKAQCGQLPELIRKDAVKGNAFEV